MIVKTVILKVCRQSRKGSSTNLDEKESIGMSDSKEIQKDTTIRNMIFGVLLVLGLIWLNTFVHQNSFQGDWGYYSFLKTALIAAVCTGIYYCWLNNNPLDGPIRNSTKLCAVGAAVSGVLMLAAMLLELGGDSFSLYGEKEIILWWISIPKKYAYDVWAIIWFPFNINVIFKAMRKERFKAESVFYACIAVLGLTLEGILIFRPMANIWLVDLMILNITTLALAMWKYALTEEHVKKGNAVAVVMLYAVMRIALLPLQCNSWGEKFTTFIYGEEWSELISGINEIVENASFFGTSNYLLNSEFAHNWLSNCNKPLLQLLFFGGWSSVIILILLFVCFIIILMKLLGVKNGRKHRNWLIFATAAVMLSLRTVFGVLYSFGVPYPIGLPFLGSNGSIMDVMAFTLILFGAWENRKILRFYQIDTTFILAEELLGSQADYIILDEDGDPYEEEVYDEEVYITGKDITIHCDAERYDIYGREFCVFTTRSTKEDRKRFILEYADGKWVLLADSEDSIQEEIRERYIYGNRPDCMEGEVRDIDEEDDYEAFENF